jgi:sarcosine/dimethylglycine N-methyltransferase
MTTQEARADSQQEFGDEPLEVRSTDHYQEEYIQAFVERWDDLIDWDGRAKSEGDFFIRLLREHGAERVLDVATGTGYHSVQLLRAGFDVTSVDGNPNMLAQAFHNARDRDLILHTVHSDWRWLCRDLIRQYDAVICLGNSFTHLFSDHTRRRVLAEFYSMLRDDGILILDQRNYDALLDDQGGGPSHQYYYVGENVKAEPEYVDDGLARFRYEFPDEFVFHLNMCPLRKDYVRSLMQEVGFQEVDTYGDFQSAYREYEPDFFIHVAHKRFVEEGDEQPMTHYSDVVRTAQSYYNSEDAETFYSTIWGGEDIHVGLYEDREPIREASHRTVQRMLDQLEKGDTAGSIGPNSRIIDLGGGYGGSARLLAQRFGARTVSLNLSEAENERARGLNERDGLADQVMVLDGDFENVPYEDNEFDVVWSQDSFLHSGDRERVLAEIRRVLKPGGHLIFTDPMQSKDCSQERLQPVLDRLQLDSLGSPEFYEEQLAALGFEKLDFIDLSHQLPRHYGRVREELQARYNELVPETISQEYADNMLKGLGHWVAAGEAGDLRWGIFHYRLPQR